MSTTTSFFARETRIIKLDEENSVTLTKLNYGENQTIMGSALSFQVNMNGAKGQMASGKIDPSQLKKEQLLASVIAWEGPGFEGRPCTRENILSLPVHIADIIQAGLDEFVGNAQDDTTKKP